MKLVWKDMYVAVGGIDVSDHVHQASVDLETEEIDITPLGAVDYRQTMQGETMAAQFGVSLHADPAVDNALRGTATGGLLNVALRPRRSLSVSATNPQYQADCILVRDTWGAAVGESTQHTLQLVSSGSITITDTGSGGGAFYGEAIYGEAVYGG